MGSKNLSFSANFSQFWSVLAIKRCFVATHNCNHPLCMRVHHQGCNAYICLVSPILSCDYDLRDISFERCCLKMNVYLCASKRTHGQRDLLVPRCHDLNTLDTMVVWTIAFVVLFAMRVFDKRYLFALRVGYLDRHALCNNYSFVNVALHIPIQHIWCYVGTLAYLNDHALTSFLKPSLRCILPPTTTLCILMTSFNRHLGSRFNALYTGALENLPMTS